MILENAILTDVKGMDMSAADKSTGSQKGHTIDKTSDAEAQYFYVSYTHKDIAVILPIIQRLRMDGYHIWYDEDILAGAEWAEQICEALLNSQGILCFISEVFVISNLTLQEVTLAESYQKNRIIVQLSDTEIPAGYSLYLNRYQHIRYYSESDFNVFIHRLESAMDFVLCNK